MDAVNDIIKCKLCNETYENPIILSCCNESICKKHIYENKYYSNIFTCFCNFEHDLAQASFLEDRTIQKLLNYDFDKFKFDKAHNDSKNMCLDLNKLKTEFKALLDNPNSLVDDHISHLRAKVDQRREELKLEIDRVSEDMLNKLESFKNECLSNLKANKLQDKYLEKLELMNDELDVDECLKELNSLVIDMPKWNSYLHEATYQLNQTKNLIDCYKNELFANKTSSFVDMISLEKFKEDYSKHLSIQTRKNDFLSLKLMHLSKLALNDTDVIDSDFVVYKNSKFDINAKILKDNDNELYLSYYLGCKNDSGRFAEGIYVDAYLKILNLNDPSKSMMKRMKITFNKEEVLGVPKFIKIKDLMDENNGFYDKNEDFCMLEIEFNEFAQ